MERTVFVKGQRYNRYIVPESASAGVNTLTGVNEIGDRVRVSLQSTSIASTT